MPEWSGQKHRRQWTKATESFRDSRVFLDKHWRLTFGEDFIFFKIHQLLWGSLFPRVWDALASMNLTPGCCPLAPFPHWECDFMMADMERNGIYCIVYIVFYSLISCLLVLGWRVFAAKSSVLWHYQGAGPSILA